MENPETIENEQQTPEQPEEPVIAQGGEEQKIEETNEIQITKFEFEQSPQEEIELVADPTYFSRECKKLKNTEGSIKKLLKNKKSANWWTKCDADGNTLMHIVLKNSWFTVFSELMKIHPSSVYVQNKEGKTPIGVFLEQEQNDSHKICFNIIMQFFNNLAPELRNEIIDFANEEDNVYYKSVMGPNAFELKRDNTTI